ncbi:hypothetical protein CEXT_762221 [Caerostris extrusa]|uniref:Uncharacterized protein n=1 Tax=Caerostris extrusa TaxID=172846 RepID=A0AAV4NWE1_CAEEX|nr:hypothetical protein CEXT_762221 [Caerostris extrusa]
MIMEYLIHFSSRISKFEEILFFSVLNRRERRFGRIKEVSRILFFSHSNLRNRCSFPLETGRDMGSAGKSSKEVDEFCAFINLVGEKYVAYNPQKRKRKERKRK